MTVGAPRHGARERRRRADAALQHRGDFLQLRLGEATPGAPGVDELSVLVGTEVERAESRARTLGPREPHDDELVHPVGAYLQPVGRATGAVGGVRLFRDDAFETELHDLLVQRFAILLEVLDVLDRAHAGDDLLEERPAFLEGNRPYVVPLEREQVEHVQHPR